MLYTYFLHISIKHNFESSFPSWLLECGTVLVIKLVFYFSWARGCSCPVVLPFPLFVAAFFVCLTVAFLGSPLYLLLSPCWPIWSYGSLFQSIRYAMTTQTFKTQVIWWFLLLYERRPQWCSYQSGYRWHSLSLSANKYYKLLRSLVSLTIICFFLQTFWLIVYSVISVRTCLFLYSNMKSKLHAWNTINYMNWFFKGWTLTWPSLFFAMKSLGR